MGLQHYNELQSDVSTNGKGNRYHRCWHTQRRSGELIVMIFNPIIIIQFEGDEEFNFWAKETAQSISSVVNAHGK
jgi:hypothetical protein